MRKYVKNQLINIIEQLSNVNETLLKNVSVLAFEQVQSILTDCQQMAVSIGTKIEETEGEGTETVALLEGYCERMYQLFSQWGNVGFCEKELKKIRPFLNQIKNSVLYNIENSKQEIVFLPYKASMWDSLESIWEKACEDANCNVRVIPIPYYDKKPDGSLCEMHYEGGEYPLNVPITHYEDYDLEANHPDVIFIHNPYDEANFVTTIHPFFYSKNIRQYTDKLVYIPYFVLGEPNVESEQSLESISHFITTPGVLYADRVIVQSENMRQAYIKVLVKLMGKDWKDKSYWEEKILGLGSPKLDKVAKAKREEQEIPEEWKKHVFNQDGTWRKIVLYNTTIDALLKNNEKMVEKIKQALDVFYQNKDNVTLLWRPHPLIKATIKSMRPGLWKAYEDMVEDYIKSDWGIYDDTSNMHRAIAISDAYYGDWSSLVQLYQVTHKPIMIQNANVTD